MDNIKRLKRYFGLGSSQKEIKKAELLSSNEALKDFGRLWGANKGDVMTMLAVLEYEFISEGGYTEIEIVTMKRVLGNMGKFFRDCSKEWQEYLATQKK